MMDDMVWDDMAVSAETEAAHARLVSGNLPWGEHRGDQGRPVRFYEWRGGESTEIR